MEKKYFLVEYTGEKPPKMIFVSRDGREGELYIDGKLVKGITDLTIHASIDDIVRHTIEYVTALSE
jgi:hypothetical protein